MTLRTVACQAPLSMGFSRQEHWTGLPFPSPEDLPNPGIEPRFPALQADSLPSEPPGKPQVNKKVSFANYKHIMPTLPIQLYFHNGNCILISYFSSFNKGSFQQSQRNGCF